MKKLALFLSILLLFSLSFSACKKDDKSTSSKVPEMSASDAAVGESIANPMVESSKYELNKKYGFHFVKLKKAQNVNYWIINKTLGEMQFDTKNAHYNYRQKKCDAFEDISGMNYEIYTSESNIKISGTKAILKSVKDGENYYEICLWYDENSKIMYSLTGETANFDNLNLKTIASELYIPAN